MAEKKEKDKAAAPETAKPAEPERTKSGSPPISEALRQELASLSNTQRAAVLMLLLGEDLASNIISYLDPKEVQELGAAMVSVSELSQEAINTVLDQFVDTLKKQTSMSLGATDYVETVPRNC